MRYILTISVLTFFLAFQSKAQLIKGNDGNALLIDFTYAFQKPGGDLSSRFGNNFNIGGGLDFVTPKNWILGTQINVLFGNSITGDVLSNLRDEQGNIFGDVGQPAEIQLRQRGMYLGGHIGRLIPFSSINRRAGLRVTLGVGLLQHKVRVQEDPLVFVTAIEGDYRKGYDHLTNGLALTEFIGYQYLAKNRRINFYIGIEMTQGFTQNRRDFNFDTQSKDTFKRNDLLWGGRVGWVLPFYFEDNPDEIFY